MMNSEFDEHVFQLIKQGNCHQRNIVPLTDRHFRHVDKALQRLRRKNRIVYASPVQGWKIVEIKPVGEVFE